MLVKDQEQNYFIARNRPYSLGIVIIPLTFLASNIIRISATVMRSKFCMEVKENT